MRRRRILVLNQYFPPDTAATAIMAARLVEALAVRHQVTVIAGRPSYNPTHRHGFYLWRWDPHPWATVLRVGSTACSRYRMRNRLVNYLSYLALALVGALVVPADVLIAMTDPPVVGIVAALVAWLRRRPFVYNIRDLHPDMALASGLIRPARWVSLWERLHRWALRRATCIIVLGEDMRRRVVAKGIPAEKVVVIRDGAPIATWSSTNPEVITEIRGAFPSVVLYAGNLGHSGAWETVIKAVTLLREKDVGWVFVGEGAAKEELIARTRGLPHVRFFPFRPPEDIPSVLAAGDVHLVTLRRGLEGLVVPSKFYGILASGRPVLALVPETSDIAQVVAETGCGLVVDPDDATRLAAAVSDLLEHRERVEQMARCAQAIAPAFALEHQMERFVTLIERIAELTSHTQEEPSCGINGMSS
jgi:glycosyltransferase involved in cell wall biosynthesis